MTEPAALFRQLASQQRVPWQSTTPRPAPQTQNADPHSIDPHDRLIAVAGASRACPYGVPVQGQVIGEASVPTSPAPEKEQ